MLVDQLIRKRKDRAIAIVLGIKEREVDPILKSQPGGDKASRMMRKVILDQLNELADLACDVAMSGEGASFWFNDEIWEKRFQEMYDQAMGDANSSTE